MGANYGKKFKYSLSTGPHHCFLLWILKKFLVLCQRPLRPHILFFLPSIFLFNQTLSVAFDSEDLQRIVADH